MKCGHLLVLIFIRLNFCSCWMTPVENQFSWWWWGCYDPISFSFCNKLLVCESLPRVAECHGSRGYIRVKKWLNVDVELGDFDGGKSLFKCFLMKMLCVNYLRFCNSVAPKPLQLSAKFGLTWGHDRSFFTDSQGNAKARDEKIQNKDHLNDYMIICHPVDGKWGLWIDSCK